MSCAPLAGITPGEVALLEVAPLPDLPVKMSTGVPVIYADRESFTHLTPEGHALSAWTTFSASRGGGTTIARTQALERTRNLFIALGCLFDADRTNDRFWARSLEGLATSPAVAAPVRWLRLRLRRRRAAG